MCDYHDALREIGAVGSESLLLWVPQAARYSCKQPNKLQFSLPAGRLGLGIIIVPKLRRSYIYLAGFQTQRWSLTSYTLVIFSVYRQVDIA